MSINDRLIEVYSVSNPAQLIIVQQLLQDVGIESYSVNDNMPEVFGKFPNFIRKPSTSICVRSLDVQQATMVCQEIDRRTHGVVSDEDGETASFCFHCGDEVTAVSIVCEHCGGDLT